MFPEKLIHTEDIEILCLLNNTKEVGLESQPLVNCIRYFPIHNYVKTKIFILMRSISLIKFICKYTQEDANKGGIYLIKCHENNALYVGQAKIFVKRWLEHQGCLYKNSYKSTHLQNSYNKYGIEKFEFLIKEYLPDDLQKIAYRYKATDDEYLPVAKWLNEKEKYYIAKYRKELGERKVFNYTTGGDHPQPNKELREKHSVASKNMWQFEEYIKKQRKYFDDEQWKEKQSIKRKEMWKNPDYRKRNCETRRKTMSTTKYRKEQSARSKKIWENKEYHDKRIAEIRRYMKNESTRKKLSENNRSKEPEIRKRISNTVKELWKNP